MILRYYDFDPYSGLENELLFTGSEEDAKKYLLKRWSVDMLEYDIELSSTFCYYLNHIQIGRIKCPTLYNEDTIKRLYEEDKDWDGPCEWTDINPNDYIFNREVIEIL
jgi:hypothetical protein